MQGMGPSQGMIADRHAGDRIGSALSCAEIGETRAMHCAKPLSLCSSLAAGTDLRARRGVFNRRGGSRLRPGGAITVAVKNTAASGIIRRGACPSPTTPSPVVLAEAPTMGAPSPLASPRGPWRIPAAASVKRRVGRAGTVRSPTPFAEPRVRLTLTRASAHRHASNRGVLPSLFEETVQ